jgi:TatD DNase family protein
MGLADVHAHLSHPRVEMRVEQLLSRARAVGVTTVISNGLNPEDNEAVWRLAREFTLVKPAFGLYPVEAVRPELTDLQTEYPKHSNPVSTDAAIEWIGEHVDDAIAIGEIGLDGHWVPESLWQKQEEVFRRLVRVALEANKPIIVHSRKREKRALEILLELGAPRVLWHCFGGKYNLAQQIAASGHYLSIPSNAERAENFKRMLKGLPREKILFETDCPYLSLVRDRESEPADIVQTATLSAELWNVSREEVEAQTTENFVRLFGAEP